MTNWPIALVITELDPGGAENCLTELALFLKQLQADVQIWSLGPEPRAPLNVLTERLHQAQIPVHFGDARGWTSLPRTTRWLRRELIDFQPRLVQSMLWHANVLAAWALRGTRVPHFGGMRVSEPRRSRWMVERYASKRMVKMICVSDLVRDHAEFKQRIAPDKLLVIPNGVSDSLLEQSSSRASTDWSELGLSAMACQARKVLFVGRLEPQKGVVPLIESAASWIESDPAHAWRLIIMGRGTQADVMREAANNHHVAERVDFVGWQPCAPKWMASSDLIVLPAEYEGMPNVLLEAMAVGKPFVAFAVDGVAQLVSATDGYDSTCREAQLVAAGDWPAFEASVRRLMQDEQLRDACGAANRAHVQTHFALTRQLAKYVELYCGGSVIDRAVDIKCGSTEPMGQR